MSTILLGFLASLGAGLMTGLGALPALLGHAMGTRGQDTLLGFAAGVMLAASFFSLIIPAIEHSAATQDGMWIPALIAVAGVVIGAGAMALADMLIPHWHPVQGRQGPASPLLSKVWLFVAAITIHNFPEGLAVGVGFSGGDTAAGATLAVGIGLQHIPEGLAVAVALISIGHSRIAAFLIALATGLIEPVGGLLGVSVAVAFRPLLPWALVFAAGAMIYVVSHEIIPETHSRGFQREATGGLIVGLVLMMFLDVALG
ncbi:MAG: ZIP family metal transporter [Alphaproteobacteria bacterium]